MPPLEGTAAQPSGAEPRSLEWMLQSPLRRALIVLIALVVLSLVSTFPMRDALEARGREVDFIDLFLWRLVSWAPWGLFAEPLIRIAGAVRNSVPTWPARLLAILPITLACAYGVSWYDIEVETRAPYSMWERGRFRSPGGERGPDGRSRGELEQRDSDSSEASMQGEASARPKDSSGRDEGERGSERRNAREGGLAGGTEADALDGQAVDARGARASRSPSARDEQSRTGTEDSEGANDSRREGGAPRSPRPTREDFRTIWRKRRLPRDLALVWMILGLGAGAESFLLARRKDREASQLLLRSSQLETELATSNLSSLRRQLHPHFLFNALHSVGGLVRAKDPKGSLRALSLLGDLLRSMLEHGEDQTLPLSEEVALATRYLKIEQIRFGERLNVDMSIADDCKDIVVPSMLLLPLVENAVRHGLASLESGGTVSVSALRTGDRLLLQVQDDGIGFPESTLERFKGAPLSPNPKNEGSKQTSLGLANEARRLQLMYADEHRFDISNRSEGGACVRIELPWRHTSTEAR
ncbi:MAG: anti-sigma regulatory factor (Ser/Thr protein kinase) [Planctomycetota bacterium]|jgi:anti-sigma regulatory factor (Ser/Thr protein kinase)